MNQEIKEEIDKVKDKLIIVEGKKDKRALEQLGCKRIITLEKKALFEVVEMVEEKEVIILTDMDAEGKRLYGKLKRMFSKRGVKVLNDLRLLLFRHKVSHVEGLHE